MSIIVSPATATEVSASISTPVRSAVRAVAVISTASSVTSMSTVTPCSAIGWHSGTRSGVRLAPAMPAIRATATASPFGTPVPRSRATTSGLTSTRPAAVATRVVTAFCADVDHPGRPGLVDVGQPRFGHWSAPSISTTSTSAPAGSSVTSSGTTTRQLARARWATRCEPGPPTWETWPPPYRPRRNCRRPAGERSGPVSRAGHVQPVGGGVAQRAPQRRAHEDLEGDERADRVAGQGHHRDAVDGAGALRPARLHRDLGELDGAQRAERVLDDLVGARAHAAAGDQQVGRRSSSAAHGARGTGRRRPGRSAAGGPRRRPPRPRRPAARSWTRRSGRAAAARPGRRARCRWTAPGPAAGGGRAASSTPDGGGQPELGGAQRGRRRCSATEPGGDVLAGRRAGGCRRRGRRGSRRSRCRASVSSTGITTSAPGGSGAPVMIRCTVPGASGTTSVRPAGMSSATGSRTGRLRPRRPPRPSGRRSRPSRSCRSRAARRPPATSRASTRPCAAASGTVSSASGATAARRPLPGVPRPCARAHPGRWGEIGPRLGSRAERTTTEVAWPRSTGCSRRTRSGPSGSPAASRCARPARWPWSPAWTRACRCSGCSGSRSATPT